MTDQRNPPEVPPRVERNADGTIIPGTQPPHMPQVLRGSAFAAMPETPFTPDPAIAGGQMPRQPGEQPKMGVDPNQPVYANPQSSGTWAANRPMGEKERIERELNEGMEDDRMAGADNTPNEKVVATSDVHDVPAVHDAPASEGEHAQETEEARRLREEQERLEREREDAERQEQKRRQQEEMQHQNPPQE